MSSERIQLQLVTSSGSASAITVQEVYVPTPLGDTGILENHLPLLALLAPGEIRFTDIHQKKHSLFIKDGFMEVANNKVAIISDSIEPAESLLPQKENILAELKEIENKIKSLSAFNPGLSADEMQKVPDELEKTGEYQKILDIKLKIIRQLEEKK